MYICENCVGEFNRMNGIYHLEFGFVCFDCYEEIKKVFNSKYIDYPKCKCCGNDLINQLEVERNICRNCFLKDIQLFIARRDDACFQLDYWYQQEQLSR
jgi:hypothetical protein